MPIPQLPLSMKIGQMLMVGFRGLVAPENSTIMRNIREQHVGSVVLFDSDSALGTGSRNIRSPQQVSDLIRTLQDTADTPLLIATDQEGGRVNRLKEEYGFPATFSAAYLGGQNDLEQTRLQARTTAKVLAGLGINLNLAPVVDLNTYPFNPIIGMVERSFSADPRTVTAHSRAFIREHRAENVLCTLKHFPGHGSSRGDTHYGFVDVTNTWTEAELEPYREIIRRGECDAIMTAHIFNAKFDKQRPATLSKPIITGILRDELGYDGVVISDDMQMQAISKYYSFESAVQSAVLAGVDIIAVANNIRFADNVAARAAVAIRQLIDDGIISSARIDQSYERIMRLKARLVNA